MTATHIGSPQKIVALRTEDGDVISKETAINLIAVIAYLGLSIKQDGNFPKIVKENVAKFVSKNADAIWEMVNAWVTSGTNAPEQGVEVANNLFECINNMHYVEDLIPLKDNLVKSLRKAERALSIKGDTETFDVTKADLLDKALAFLSNPKSNASFLAMQKNSSRLGPEIGSLFIKSADTSLGDFSVILQNLLKLRRAISPRKPVEPIFLVPDERKDARSNPKVLEKFKEYLAVERQVKQKIDITLRSIADGQKSKLISTQAAWAALQAAGINVWPFHPELKKTGLKVKINTSGKLTTSDGAVLQGGNISNNPNYTIVFNENYIPGTSSNYLTLKPASNTSDEFFIPKQSQYISTEEGVVARHAGKAAKTSDIMTNLDKYKSKWRKAMKPGAKLTQSVLMSYTAEYLYATASRFGDTLQGTNPDKLSFGASSFKIKHILNLPKPGALPPVNLKIKYPVKGAHNVQLFQLNSQDETILDEDDRKYLKLLKKFICDNANRLNNKEAIVMSLNGKSKIPTLEFNSWFRATTGSKASSHSFRHVKGTLLFNNIIEKEMEEKKTEIKKAKAESTVKLAALINNIVKDAATQVGSLLGHVSGENVTHTTAIKNYILPEAIRNVYNPLNVAPSNAINKAMSRDKGDV